MKSENKDLLNNKRATSNENKKTYNSPNLKSFGKIAELTQGASVANTECGTHKK